MIMMSARNISIAGTVTSNALNGNNSSSGGGGGGGSGGSILINTIVANIGTSLITATGGSGGLGTPSLNGRAGAVGRIAIYYNSSLTGTSNPVAFTQLFTPN